MTAITQQYPNALWGRRRTFSDKTPPVAPPIISEPHYTWDVEAESLAWKPRPDDYSIHPPGNETTWRVK